MSEVLVAGVGNIFSSDDGFGVEVATRLVAGLAACPLPAGVRVGEYGIRGVHLAYELLEGCDALILVDAVPMGEPPGTVAVMEPTDVGPIEGGAPWGEGPADAAPMMDAHSMSPDVVLGTLARLGGRIGRVVVVGCQPGSLADGIGLSPAVAAAVDPAVDLCRELAADMVVSAGDGEESFR